jgi:hypothetical protein
MIWLHSTTGLRTTDARFVDVSWSSLATREGWNGTVLRANQYFSISEAIAVNAYNGAWPLAEAAIKGRIGAANLRNTWHLAKRRAS